MYMSAAFKVLKLLNIIKYIRYTFTLYARRGSSNLIKYSSETHFNRIT
jgi:hypothetical protein